MRSRIDLSRHGFSFSMSANNQHHVDDLFMVLVAVSIECPDVCILAWVNAQSDLPSAIGQIQRHWPRVNSVPA